MPSHYPHYMQNSMVDGGVPGERYHEQGRTEKLKKVGEGEYWDKYTLFVKDRRPPRPLLYAYVP